MPKIQRKNYDVIILGGGPAGLGCAVNLAERGISVLLVERHDISSTSKTWLTFDDVLKKYALEECIRNRFSEILFSCYLGNSYAFANRDFIYPIHEEKALALLARRATAQGAVIKDKEPFINYRLDEKDGTVIINTTKSTYQARLAVDAMGRDSQLLPSRGLTNDTIDMGCLSFFLEDVNHKNDNAMLLYDSFFPGPDYFWLVPLEENKVMAGIFFFSSLSGCNLKEKAGKLELYLQAKNLKGRVYDTRKGNIPLGNQRRIHTESILCMGDSCNTALPSSGFSFNRCLEESELLAGFVEQYLDAKLPLSEYKNTILGSKIPAIEIHLMISDMLSKFTDPMLNKAIGEMKNLDEEFLVSFLSGRDMSFSWAVTALRAIMNTFSLAEIRSLSLKQNYLKNFSNLYNLLPALPSAKIGEQLMNFMTGIIKSDYPTLAGLLKGRK
ncbi:FAD-dependent oxidoreductase [Fibrobacterota bacterium]